MRLRLRDLLKYYIEKKQFVFKIKKSDDNDQNSSKSFINRLQELN